MTADALLTTGWEHAVVDFMRDTQTLPLEECAKLLSLRLKAIISQGGCMTASSPITIALQQGANIKPIMALISEDAFDAAHDAYQDVFDGQNHRSALRHALKAASKVNETEINPKSGQKGDKTQ